MEYHSSLQTPLGVLNIKSNGKAVYAIGYYDGSLPENPDALTEAARFQLQQYFAGSRSTFDFPLEQKGTDFQQQVWAELLKIEPGSPISYAALSKRMNNPLAIRAIASANGKNKLMIVVPCHRVIGSGGELVGYAGELWRKKWLLEHEARMMKLGQSSLLF